MQSCRHWHILDLLILLLHHLFCDVPAILDQDVPCSECVGGLHEDLLKSIVRKAVRGDDTLEFVDKITRNGLEEWKATRNGVGDREAK